MGVISEIVVPLPPDLLATVDGSATKGQAYALTMPSVATEPMTVTDADGQVFTARPTELVYSGKDAAGVRAYDYYVGSAPSTVTTNGRQARYDRVFPQATDVYVAQREGVKHYTILQVAPRLPADYLVSDVEFGVSSLIGGVPLPPGRHEHIEAWGFTLPRPFATDLAGETVYGEYEVVDGDIGQQLFVWFDATWFADSERVYPVTIDPTVSTSTLASATTSSPQHRIVRFPSNGVLLAAVTASTGILAYTSADNGGTWTAPTTGPIINAMSTGCSLALDNAENVSVGISTTTTAYYARGVPTSAARTGFTWSAASACGSASYADAVVAVVADGTGWKAGVARTFTNATPKSMLLFRRVSIDSAGVITVDATDTTVMNQAQSFAYQPSLEFEANGKLHLILNQPGGDAVGVRYFSAPLTSGSWSWSPMETVYNLFATDNRISASIDAQARPVVVMKPFTFSTSVNVFRRGASGTWAAIPNAPAMAPTSLAVVCYGDDIVLWFTDNGLKYTRAVNDVWSPIITIDSDTTAVNVSARRGTSGSASDVLYRTGSTSPYTVKSVRETFNLPPQQPTIALGSSAFAAETGTQITITHNDGDQMSAWAFKRTYGTVTEWWNNTTKAFDKVAEWWNTGASGFSVVIPAADNAGDWTTGNVYQLRAATKDSLAVEGPYNTTAVLANVGATPVVTITSPATNPSGEYTVEWTVDRAQSGYQVRVLDAATPVSDTTKVSGVSVRSRTVATPTNGKVYTVEVTIWDQTSGGGVSAPPATKVVTVSFTPPAIPPLNTSVNSAGGFIGVSWTNPVGGTAVSYNDLYRRKQGDVFKRIATQLPANGTYPDYAVASGVTYEYKATAVGTNATTTDSTIASAGVVFANGLWLHDPLDPVGSAHFFQYREVNLSDTPRLVSGDFQFVGRTFPTTRFDAKAQTRDIKLRVAALDGTTDRASLEGLLYRRTTLCFRDFKGRKVWGVVKELPGQDAKGMAWLDLNFSAVDYKEEIG